MDGPPPGGEHEHTAGRDGTARDSTSTERVVAKAQSRRERDFWGHHLPSVEEVLREVASGPDANTRAMLDAVEPCRGRRILDFACGAGATTMWLAQRGARVVGLDITPESVEVGRQVAVALGLDAEFVARPLEEFEPDGRFDGIVGRFALHHVDVAATAPLLGRMLVADGRAAFVETMATNPLLMLARNFVVGRWGVPRLGTLDEHPLTKTDLTVLEANLGRLTNRTAQPMFLRILDRQLLRYRWPTASRVFGALDDRLVVGRLAHRMSYQQVLSFRR